MTTAALGSVARVAFSVDAGCDFAVSVNVADGDTPVDLTGYSAVMQVRDSVTGALRLQRSTANNTILFDAVFGRLTVVMSAAETAAFTWRSGVYEIRLTSPGGAKSRLLLGTIVVQRGVVQ